MVGHEPRRRPPLWSIKPGYYQRSKRAIVCVGSLGIINGEVGNTGSALEEHYPWQQRAGREGGIRRGATVSTKRMGRGGGVHFGFKKISRCSPYYWFSMYRVVCCVLCFHIVVPICNNRHLIKKVITWKERRDRSMGTNISSFVE